jgi:3alpha(or 20beta)-hydroxysteroid dehydrogenase
MGRLEGKVALVTGAARGVGAAIATRFHHEGARVVLTDVRDAQGEAVAAQLGEPARFLHLDVTQPADWDRAMAEIGAGEGHLNILVNNAAVLHMSLIDKTSISTFKLMMDVNVMGVFLGTQKALPLLRDSGDGSIINIGSIDGVTPAPATGAYAASKFAVRGLTRSTAIENGKYGVRANCICPATGNLDMIRDAIWSLPESEVAAIADEACEADRSLPFPLRAGNPEDVAATALYFASSDSAFCTGAELILDGGLSAGMYMDIPNIFDTRSAISELDGAHAAR